MMKYINFLICTVVIFLGLIIFTGNRAELASVEETGKKKITFAETLTAELAELAKAPIRTTADGHQEISQMGKDRSVIHIGYDSFGNKTESRVFYNDFLLKMVVVKTSANGEREVLAYGQNGEVKIVPQNMIDKALTANAAEIAKAVEIFEGRKENEMIARLNAPPVELTEEALLNGEQTVAEPTAATVETETATEQAETKTETVETNKIEETKTETQPVQTEDSSLKLRAAVQSLKATKKANRNFSNDQLTAKAN